MTEDNILFERKIPEAFRIIVPEQSRTIKLYNRVLLAVSIVLILFTPINGWLIFVSAIFLARIPGMFRPAYDAINLTSSQLSFFSARRQQVKIELSGVIFFDYYALDEDKTRQSKLMVHLRESHYSVSLKELRPESCLELLHQLHLLGFRINMMDERLEYPDSKYYPGT